MFGPIKSKVESKETETPRNGSDRELAVNSVQSGRPSRLILRGCGGPERESHLRTRTPHS
jgi:hypothetical protein